MFYNNQPAEAKEAYKEYLKSMGALSRLFSTNADAYLDSRVVENLFCKSFGAENSARDDSTADACKGDIGIGIKTFIHSPKSLQKIAEFNAIRNLYVGKSAEEVIKIIAEARNERIRSTMEIYGLESMIYHCVTRQGNKINIFEQIMHPIINIKWNTLKETKSSICFDDKFHHYSFNKSKSVLQMHFELSTPIDSIETCIIDKPINYIVDFLKSRSFDESSENIVMGKDAIYLPLYAPSSKENAPEDKSGLNQWNAAPRRKRDKNGVLEAEGKPRHADEVYIPIPIEIHQKFPEFFVQSNEHIFDLKLPNGKILSAKLCQSNSKGLMSNPNKDLGHWILRDVMELPEKTLVTREILDTLNIDSVLITKETKNRYKIDFASCGKFEEFKEQYLD